LHGFLEVGKDFSTWIKDRILKFDFVENEHFVKLTKNGERINTGFERIDYILKIDTAKEIAMVENNEDFSTIRNFVKAKDYSPVLGNPLNGY